MKVKNTGSRYRVRALRDFIWGDRNVKRGEEFTVTKWQAIALANQGKTESAASTAAASTARGLPAPKKRKAVVQGRRSVASATEDGDAKTEV